MYVNKYFDIAHYSVWLLVSALHWSDLSKIIGEEISALVVYLSQCPIVEFTYKTQSNSHPH